MIIRYFAWLRDHTGCAQENRDCPATVTNVSELITYLCENAPAYQQAFANRGVIKVAINQEFASHDSAVKQGDEIAFFPPVTGG